MNYNGVDYYYRKNILGDVIAIYDTDGNKVCSYAYDAWGNHSIEFNEDIEEAEDLANLNPFRYRGYYYDQELGLYYLQSRYYDPEVGRFISADDVSYLAPESIFGLNLYAYCNDNPVMYTDPTGNDPKWWEWLLFGGAVAVITAASIVASVASGGLFVAAAGIALGGMGAMVGNFLSQGVSKGFDNIDLGELGIKTLFGSMYGLACTVPGGGALFAKAGVSALESMTMSLYKSDGEASVGDVITSGIQGFVFSIVLQKVGGSIMDKLNYGGLTPLWGNATKPETLALMAGGMSVLRKYADFVMPTILGPIKKCFGK